MIQKSHCFTARLDLELRNLIPAGSPPNCPFPWDFLWTCYLNVLHFQKDTSEMFLEKLVGIFVAILQDTTD